MARQPELARFRVDLGMDVGLGAVARARRLGADAAARGDVYNIIQQLRNHGVAVMLISSDMEEIVELSDRAVTVFQGRIIGEFAKKDINQDNLMAAAFGVTGGKQVQQ